jgi:hypothetical protein
VLLAWSPSRTERFAISGNLDASEDERRRLTLQLSPVAAAPELPRPLGRRILAWLARQHGVVVI